MIEEFSSKRAGKVSTYGKRPTDWIARIEGQSRLNHRIRHERDTGDLSSIYEFADCKMLGVGANIGSFRPLLFRATVVSFIGALRTNC
jgi:hypothetical protein